MVTTNSINQSNLDPYFEQNECNGAKNTAIGDCVTLIDRYANGYSKLGLHFNYFDIKTYLSHWIADLSLSPPLVVPMPPIKTAICKIRPTQRGHNTINDSWLTGTVVSGPMKRNQNVGCAELVHWKTTIRSIESQLTVYTHPTTGNLQSPDFRNIDQLISCN